MPVNRKQREDREVEFANVKDVIQTQEQVGSTPTCYKVPEGFEVFDFDAKGDFEIDFMPYLVGKGNPEVKEGKAHYARTYWAHKAGVSGRYFVCNHKTIGKKCPVCEHQDKLSMDPRVNKEVVNALWPKRRQLACVRVLNSDEPKVFRLFDYPFPEFGRGNTFGEMLKAKLDAMRDNDPRLGFFHPTKGSTALIRAVEDSYKGKTFYRATNIEFEPRQRQYTMGLLDEVPCLDDLIIPAEYERLAQMFHNGEEPSGEEAGGRETPAEEESDRDGSSRSGRAAPTRSRSRTTEVVREPDPDPDPVPESEDDTPAEISKGDEVEWERKGKVMTGEVVRIDAKNNLAHVKSKDREDPFIVDLDELTVVDNGGTDPEDPEDEEPVPAKRGGGANKKGDEPPAHTRRAQGSAGRGFKDEEEDPWASGDDEPADEPAEDEPAPKRRSRK